MLDFICIGSIVSLIGGWLIAGLVSSRYAWRGGQLDTNAGTFSPIINMIFSIITGPFGLKENKEYYTTWTKRTELYQAVAIKRDKQAKNLQTFINQNSSQYQVYYSRNIAEGNILLKRSLRHKSGIVHVASFNNENLDEFLADKNWMDGLFFNSFGSGNNWQYSNIDLRATAYVPTGLSQGATINVLCQVVHKRDKRITIEISDSNYEVEFEIDQDDLYQNPQTGKLEFDLISGEVTVGKSYYMTFITPPSNEEILREDKPFRVHNPARPQKFVKYVRQELIDNFYDERILYVDAIFALKPA